MPNFGRDTDIGYPVTGVQSVEVVATVPDVGVVNALEVLQEATFELRRIRRATELILGTEVEDGD